MNTVYLSTICSIMYGLRLVWHVVCVTHLRGIQTWYVFGMVKICRGVLTLGVLFGGGFNESRTYSKIKVALSLVAHSK